MQNVWANECNVLCVLLGNQKHEIYTEWRSIGPGKKVLKKKKVKKKKWSFADFKLQLLNEQLFGKFQ